jgi:hypothetical protein
MSDFDGLSRESKNCNMCTCFCGICTCMQARRSARTHQGLYP